MSRKWFSIGSTQEITFINEANQGAARGIPDGASTKALPLNFPTPLDLLPTPTRPSWKPTSMVKVGTSTCPSTLKFGISLDVSSTRTLSCPMATPRIGY